MEPNYEILKAPSDYDLQILVNNYVEDGYEPAGGLTILVDKSGYHDYFQAVFRKAEHNGN